MITPNYASFLVRIWQDGEAHNGTWLASLEDISTKKLTYFTSMAELFAFLGQAAGEDRDEEIRKN